MTLTGLGGIGKTRLAIEVASEVVLDRAAFADGVWLVALEAISDDRQVVGQIASVLGLREASGRTLLHSLTDHLRKKRLLLVLDNCEHLLQASAQVAEHLLRECAEVRILATSRKALGITGETSWAVPALAVPTPEHLPKGNATLMRVLMGYESVRLFIERAQAVQKSFALTGNNALCVAHVCFRLEGIPLAIELAAARIKGMAVEQIEARLDNELGLLIGGSRTAQARQQTLRAMLDWSYALLTEQERMLLRRLSVFAGGWTLEAAESICAGKEMETWAVPSLLTALVDKSLVSIEERHQRGGGRYRLLEVVRQYAEEKLQVSAENREVATRHRDWFVMLSETAEPELTGPAQKLWVERLASEYDNLRVVMARCGQEPEAAGIEAGLRLTGALWRFWYIRGDYIEGRRHLQEALAHDKIQIPTQARAKALHGEGVMCYRQGDFLSARECHAKALRIREQIGDWRGIGDSLLNLGNVALGLGDPVSGKAFYERSLHLRRELGDRHGIAMILGNLGSWALERADFAEAKTLYEESLELFREVEDRSHIAWSLHNLGIIASVHGDYPLSQRYLEECMPLFESLGERRGMAWAQYAYCSVEHNLRGCDAAQNRYQESLYLFKELGDTRGIAWCSYELGKIAIDQDEKQTARLWLTEASRLFQEMRDKSGSAYARIYLGIVALREGDFASVRALFEESLRCFHERGDKKGVVSSLEAFADLMREQSQMEKAVRLLGSARRWRDEIRLPAPPNTQAKLDLQIERARTALGVSAFAVAWEEGYSVIWEQVVTFALTQDSSEPLGANAE